jgi:hypothetical protein
MLWICQALRLLKQKRQRRESIIPGELCQADVRESNSAFELPRSSFVFLDPTGEGELPPGGATDGFGVQPTCEAIGSPVSTYDARRTGGRPVALEDRQAYRRDTAAREGYRRVSGVRKTWNVEATRRRRRPRPPRPADAPGRARGRAAPRNAWTTIPDEGGAAAGARPPQRDFTASGSGRTRTGRQHHLPADPGRLRPPRLHPRPLQPDDRRLVTRDAPPLRAGARDARDGQRPTPTRRGLIAHTDRGSPSTEPRAPQAPYSSCPVLHGLPAVCRLRLDVVGVMAVARAVA